MIRQAAKIDALGLVWLLWSCQHNQLQEERFSEICFGAKAFAITLAAKNKESDLSNARGRIMIPRVSEQKSKYAGRRATSTGLPVRSLRAKPADARVAKAGCEAET